VYHFVEGYGAVAECYGADDYAEDVVPLPCQGIRLEGICLAAYMTVRFFILYLACIWSIRGTWLCFVAFVVVSHLRAETTGAFRARGSPASDREHDVHVQDSKARTDWRRRGNVDIAAGN
jgi:hypothetical protein